MKSAITEACVRGVINSGCVGQKKMLLPFIAKSPHIFFLPVSIFQINNPLERTKDWNRETGLQQVDTSYVYTDHGRMDPLCKPRFGRI